MVQYKHYFLRHPICLTKNLKQIQIDKLPKCEVAIKPFSLHEDEAKDLFCKKLKKMF